MSTSPKEQEHEQRAPVMGEAWIGIHRDGPVVYDDCGRAYESQLFTQIDAATFYVVRAGFAGADAQEGSEEHAYSLRLAVHEHGAPLVYLVEEEPTPSLARMCDLLSVRLVWTASSACSERERNLVRRVSAMWRRYVSNSARPTRSLADLNAELELWCWGYNDKKNVTTRRVPSEQWELRDGNPWLARPDDQPEWEREQRTTDADGVFSLRGRLYQLSDHLAHRTIELRINQKKPSALPQVFLGGVFIGHALPVSRDADRPEE